MMGLNWTSQLSFIKGGDDCAGGGTWHEGSTCPPAGLQWVSRVLCVRNDAEPLTHALYDLYLM